MKTIICRRCHKNVEVEDSYELKTCEICHQLDLKDSAIRSAKSERDHDAEKLIKSLGIQKIPEQLESFSNFCEWFESRGMAKPSMQIYFNELTNYRKMEIHKQADNATDQIKGKNKEHRRYNLKFLNFDLHGFSSREKCKIYRLSIMDGKKDQRLESHLEECSECQSWQLDFSNGTLNAQYSSEIWNEEQKPCIEPESQEDKFEKWENERGFKQCCLECGTRLVNGKCPNC